jgi:hypothetical protein
MLFSWCEVNVRGIFLAGDRFSVGQIFEFCRQDIVAGQSSLRGCRSLDGWDHWLTWRLELLLLLLLLWISTLFVIINTIKVSNAKYGLRIATYSTRNFFVTQIGHHYHCRHHQLSVINHPSSVHQSTPCIVVLALSLSIFFKWAELMMVIFIGIGLLFVCVF